MDTAYRYHTGYSISAARSSLYSIQGAALLLYMTRLQYKGRPWLLSNHHSRSFSRHYGVPRECPLARDPQELVLPYSRKLVHCSRSGMTHETSRCVPSHLSPPRPPDSMPSPLSLALALAVDHMLDEDFMLIRTLQSQDAPPTPRQARDKLVRIDWQRTISPGAMHAPLQNHCFGAQNSMFPTGTCPHDHPDMPTYLPYHVCIGGRIQTPAANASSSVTGGVPLFWRLQVEACPSSCNGVAQDTHGAFQAPPNGHELAVPPSYHPSSHLAPQEPLAQAYYGLLSQCSRLHVCCSFCCAYAAFRHYVAGSFVKVVSPSLCRIGCYVLAYLCRVAVVFHSPSFAGFCALAVPKAKHATQPTQEGRCPLAAWS